MTVLLYVLSITVLFPVPVSTKDVCLPDPCIYGTCSTFEDTYRCTCILGASGRNCSTAIDPCQFVPCFHGSCVMHKTEHALNFTCMCEKGYTGRLCDTAIDYCLNAQCVHGTCRSLLTDYTCDCDSGYSGPNCNIVLSTTTTHRPVTSSHTNRHSTTTVESTTTSTTARSMQQTTTKPTSTVTTSTTRQPTTIIFTTKAKTPNFTQRPTTQTTTMLTTTTTTHPTAHTTTMPTTTTERTTPTATTHPTTPTTTMPIITTATRTTTPTTTMPTTTTIKPTTVIPVTWPVGTYGLMKAASGCPSAQVTWHSGWRAFDTQDTNENNQFSNGIAHYLAGSFNHNIRTDFCMKTTLSNSQFDSSWPNGAYCILKKGNCPTGFHSGFIYWDDEDTVNSNHNGGVLPDGEYDQNTKIYYCCRNDGQTSNAITLPVDRPFVLVRYGRTCQTVHGMNVHDLFVRWGDEDIFNSDDAGGMHPYDDGGSKDHQLHFCYYQSAGPGVIG